MPFSGRPSGSLGNAIKVRFMGTKLALGSTEKGLRPLAVVCPGQLTSAQRSQVRPARRSQWVPSRPWSLELKMPRSPTRRIPGCRRWADAEKGAWVQAPYKTPTNVVKTCSKAHYLRFRNPRDDKRKQALPRRLRVACWPLSSRNQAAQGRAGVDARGSSE